MLLGLLLPQRCAVCARPGREVCPRCRARLPCLRPPLCARCGAPAAWPVQRCRECAGRRLAFASARAAVAYDASVRALVAAWKERGLRGLAALAAELVTEVVERPDVDALVAVPADPERQLRRGHHPAEGLARALAARWDLPGAAVLTRRHSARQTGLAPAARRRNVAGAFEVLPPVPARAVVVDDVYTTGATVAEAASALRRAGCGRVDVVTFARAVRAR